MFSLAVTVHSAIVQDVMKLDHWLSQPSGSVLFIAPSGYGRRTTALIAARLQQAVIIRPKVAKAYSLRQFTLDIKRVRFDRIF